MRNMALCVLCVERDGLSGEDEAALAAAGIDALEAYFKSTGIPMTLSELKIGPEHFAEMASHANAGGYLKNAFAALMKRTSSKSTRIACKGKCCRKSKGSG